MSLPGTVVPYWFYHQSDGSSVSMQLPPSSLDHKVSGIVICAVLKNHRYLRPSSVTCLCNFKGNCGEQNFSFDLPNSDRILRSDHMFLGHVSWWFIEEGKLVNESYTEATFQIVVASTSDTEQLRIIGCGVRFVYANLDELLQLKLALPRVHGYNPRTGAYCFDPYEFENQKKRRVETLREIELLSSYALPLFPDNAMEVVNDSMTHPDVVRKRFETQKR